MYSSRVLTNKNYLYLTNVMKQARIMTGYTFNYATHAKISVEKPIISTTKLNKIGLFARIKNFIGLSEKIHIDRMRLLAALTYEKIVDNIDYELLFKEFEMPDTFLSWFLVMELHVWMVSVRLMADVNHGKRMRDELLNMMWEDHDKRLKKLGPISGTIRREHSSLLGQQLNAAFVGYDEGLLNNDKILAGALWRRFFCCETNNPEHLDKLVCYVRKEIAKLDEMPLMELLRIDNFKWSNIKTCTNV